MDDISKIRERVSKLLAMASDASSPEEAAIASRRARALMDKYQIDAASLRSMEGEGFGAKTAGQAYKFMPKWKSILSYAVGMYNDCQPMLSGSSSGRFKICFKGLNEDVDMAIDMYSRLCEAVESWCRVYMKSQGHESHYIASIGNPYKHGMASRLCSELRKLTAERDQIQFESLGESRSLVVVKKELVAQHFGQAIPPKNVKAILKSQESNRAYANGFIDGGSVAINNRVEQ